jgi:RNA polymerase sigma-70 factor, ECF subfamily
VERDLVKAAQGGDRTAFVELLRSRMDALFALAQRILRDTERAEDGLQDGLVIAWRDLRALRDADRFDAWLHRVVVRECVEQASRERRRTAGLRLLTVDAPAIPDGSMALADRDQLERGFRQLAPIQRAMLVLHHYEGYAPSEIAEILGIPPGTARSRLHHAHRAMRAALDADARSILTPGRSA